MKLFFSFFLFISILYGVKNETLQTKQNISNKTKIIVGIRAWKGIDMSYKEWSSTIDYLNTHVDG